MPLESDKSIQPFLQTNVKYHLGPSQKAEKGGPAVREALKESQEISAQLF